MCQDVCRSLPKRERREPDVVGVGGALLRGVRRFWRFASTRIKGTRGGSVARERSSRRRRVSG